MKSCPLIAWLFLLIAGLGCRLVLAAEMRPPPGAVQPDRASVVPAGYSAHQGGLPAVQLAIRQPEAIAPGEPLPSHQPASPSALSLDDLVWIAFRSNPTLVQASMAVRAAQGTHLQVGLYPNPTTGYIGDDLGNDGYAGVQGWFVGQEIVTSGKLRLGRAVAGHELQQAHYAWEAQRRRVLNSVRTGYYEVLLAKKMIEVNEQLVRIGRESARVSEQLRAAQEINRAEVLQVRIEAEKAELNLDIARNHHRAVWQRLTAVLGRPDMKPVPLAGDAAKDLPALSWEDMLTRLLAESPELGQARAGIQRARSELALQCAKRIPNFEIEGAAKYDHASEFAIADMHFVLPLKLYDRNQGNIIKAQADLIAARNELRRVELDLYDRFAAAFEFYANAQRQVETYSSTILPNAKASLDMIRVGYREGEFGYLTLLLAQETFFGVSLDYLASLSELWARTIEIEGMLLEGGLQRPE